MAELWNRVQKSLTVIRRMEHGAERHHWSARASFSFPGFRQGEVLNIDTENTVCCTSNNNVLSALVCSYYIAVACTQALMFQPATTAILQCGCVVMGIIGFLLPFLLLTLANRQLLHRILCRSFMPWVKLYMCCVETYSLCSLCSWRWRAFAITPLLLSSQQSIFIADALFYRNSTFTVLLLILFIAWRIMLIICVRLQIFGSMEYSTFTFMGFNFYNSGSFVSKSLSLLLFQVGQLVFYLRYRHRLYSIRTAYTVLENLEWNKLERKKRVDRKASHQESVEEVRQRLSDLAEHDVRPASPLLLVVGGRQRLSPKKHGYLSPKNVASF